MRKSLIALSALASLGLLGCQQDSSTQADAAATKTDASTLTDEQKQAYAMGGSMAVFVQNRVDAMQSVGGTLDTDMVAKGFSETIANNSALSVEEIQQYAQAGEQAFRMLQQQQSEQAAAKNVEAGKAFLADNAAKEGVVTTESGLQYKVLTEGSGSSPVATDTVKVHYHGTLIDGTVFDSSYERGEPAVFPLNRVISGWTEGVQLMKEGAKYQFYIPSDLAYGQRATGKITPNSTLIFDVELLEVVKPEGEASE